MNKYFKKYIKDLIRSIIFWTLALVLWCLFRYYGLPSLRGVNIQEEYKLLLSISNLLVLYGFSGLLIGFVFGNIEYFFEKYTSNKVSIGLSLVFKTALYLISLVAISSLGKALASKQYHVEVNSAGHWWLDKQFYISLVYILLVSIAFSFIKIATDKFGKGVFLKLLLGRYKKPQEERRIFMFLDLKSSTTIAERLGHLKYSQLIQDCFYDLNDVVPKHAAEIYQYVGDEAVLSWPYKKGLANNNCIRMYFDFAATINKKASYYKQKYGVVPLFKAGLHGGTLMVAEVGVVKKELAFHGDVINTSARIQGECNNYDVPILISESLKNELNPSKVYSSKHMGNVHLKGKEHKVNIYTLMEL